MTAAAHGAEVVGPSRRRCTGSRRSARCAALLAFVVAVALVPYGHAWPYAIDAALLAAVVVASRTPPSLLARRLVVEIPFVAFVLVLPFVAQGPQVDVLGVGVARDGLWAARRHRGEGDARRARHRRAGRRPRRCPRSCAGLERLRAPRQLTAIGAFALRYLQLVLDELRPAAQRAHRPRRRPALAVAGAHRGALRRRAGRALPAARRARARGDARARLRRAHAGHGPRGARRARWRGPRRSRCRRSRWRRPSPCGGSRDRPAHHRAARAREVDEPPALLVVGHGSRDADGVEEFWALVADHPRGRRRRCRSTSASSRWPSRWPTSPSTASSSAALTDIVSVPLVLLAAGHLKNDGPATLARARQRHPDVRFRMGRDLGIDPVVLAVVEDRIRAAIGEDDPAEVGVVLVGRGSSDPDACGDLFKFGRLLADGRGLGTVEPAFVSRRPARRARAPWSAAAAWARARSSSRRCCSSPACSCRASTARRRTGPPSTPRSTCAPPPTSAPTRASRGSCSSATARPSVGDVRMNCDLCTYRVRLPSYEDKVGMPISLTPHGDAPARGKRRARRATRAPLAPIELAPRRPGLRPAPAVEVPAGTPPALDVRGLRFAYPDGTPGARRRRPAGGRRASGVAVLGPNGAGKTTLVLAAQRDARGRRGRRSRSAACELGAAHARRDPPPRRDRLPGPRRPALHAHRRAPTSPSARPTWACAATRCASASTRRSSASGCSDEADRAPHQLSRRRAAPRGDRRRAGVRARRADPRRADRRPGPRGAARAGSTCSSRCASTTLSSPTTSPTRSSCARARSCSTAARSSPTAPTREVLADEGFMRAHRLELPAGFNPLSA